ncbi:MAG: alginate export family protein, partial [Planctomycetota bacterium]|nr:alginate export family protein [Planctomycetota bacterium]
DWANTRRTFEGVKILYQSCDWSIDAFFTHLVTVEPFELDEADYDQPFYGVYAVYKGLSDATLDLYYLGYDNQVRSFSLHTFGARLNGERDDWLYEVEGAYQGGDAAGFATGDQSDGFITAGLGRKLMPGHSWKPTLWFYFDYASENYNQLFPLAHKYLGFIDAVQRSNIISPNILLTAKPTDKLSLLLWYYHFESATDAPVPSIGGTPPQNARRNFGDEIDLLAKYKINARNDVLIGYSHFWRGSKIANTNDADFAYVQWTMNF